MTPPRPKFLEPNSGEVLVTVVCGECGSRPLGAVQQRWSVEAPEGRSGLPAATRQFTFQGSKHGVNSLPVTASFTDREVWCRRHGFLRLDGHNLRSAIQAFETDATPVVIAVRAAPA